MRAVERGARARRTSPSSGAGCAAPTGWRRPRCSTSTSRSRRWRRRGPTTRRASSTPPPTCSPSTRPCSPPSASAGRWWWSTTRTRSRRPPSDCSRCSSGDGGDVVLAGDPDAATQTFRGARPAFLAGVSSSWRRADGRGAARVVLRTVHRHGPCCVRSRRAWPPGSVPWARRCSVQGRPPRRADGESGRPRAALRRGGGRVRRARTSAGAPRRRVGLGRDGGRGPLRPHAPRPCAGRWRPPGSLWPRRPPRSRCGTSPPCVPLRRPWPPCSTRPRSRPTSRWSCSAAPWARSTRWACAGSGRRCGPASSRPAVTGRATTCWSPALLDPRSWRRSTPARCAARAGWRPCSPRGGRRRPSAVRPPRRCCGSCGTPPGWPSRGAGAALGGGRGRRARRPRPRRRRRAVRGGRPVRRPAAARRPRRVPRLPRGPGRPGGHPGGAGADGRQCRPRHPARRGGPRVGGRGRRRRAGGRLARPAAAQFAAGRPGARRPARRPGGGGRRRRGRRSAGRARRRAAAVPRRRHPGASAACWSPR